jgi:hypothetical protein
MSARIQKHFVGRSLVTPTSSIIEISLFAADFHPHFILFSHILLQLPIKK